MIIKNLNLMNSPHNRCKSGIRRIGYPSLLLGCICLNQALFCQDTVDIKASVSGNLNCINTKVMLKCNSANAGAVYKWTGPNGYVSTAQNPVTTLPGVYTVSVINPVTHATSTAKVTVALDTVAPAGVRVSSSGILTCKDTSVILAGSSTTQGVLYNWKGPEDFTSSQKDPVISVPGIYRLTVTNPVNGCITKANITAKQNIKLPEDVIASVSGILTCNIQQVTLKGTSSTKGVEYRWTGQGLVKALRDYDVSMPGVYELEVTNPENGCHSKASVTVEQNTSMPEGLVATISDTITCKTNTVKLTASSTTKGAIFSWSGAEGITSSEHFLITSIPGNYRLQVTNPENGCSSQKTATVIKDINPPEDVKVTSSGEINCIDNKVTLACTSPTQNITYNWSGPGGFSSGLAAPKVDKKGTYYVEATKVSNGCSVKKSIIVTENIAYPKNIAATSSGTISCETPRVKLTGKSTTSKVNFTWKGPDGFSSDLKEPVVTLPGKYILSVTDPVNGCKSETSVAVAGEVCKEN